MKKKIIVLILSILALFLILNFARAQNEIPLPGGINTGQIENTTNQIGNAAGQFANPQWNYIEQEIQKALLQNSFVNAINSFLQKISFIFVILFAEPYSLSMTLLMIIALWFYFLIVFNNIFKLYASLSKWVSRAVSLLAVIILAQLKFFEAQINFLTWFGFGNKPWWVKVIIWAVVVGLLILIMWLIKTFGVKIFENRKKMKEEENRVKLEMGAKISEAFGQTVGKSLEEGK